MDEGVGGGGGGVGGEGEEGGRGLRAGERRARDGKDCGEYCGECSGRKLARQRGDSPTRGEAGERPRRPGNL